MATRDFNEIKTSLDTTIKSKIPTADITITPFRDLIDTFANELALANEDVQAIQDIQNLSNPEQLAETDLDDLAKNFGLTRNEGSKSSGKISFYRKTLPVSPIIIPAGTTVSTKRTIVSIPEEFVTIFDVTFDTLATFDSDQLAYFVEADIIATTATVQANVASNTITELVTSIGGIDFILNSNPTSGGTDIETNTELANRIQQAKSRFGTAPGIAEAVTNNFTVTDLQVIRPQDPEMERNQWGSAVDVIILGENIFQTQEIFSHTTGSVEDFLPIQKPFRAVVSILVFQSSIQVQLVEGTDFDVVKEENPLIRSAQETTTIVFNPSLVIDNNSQVTVNYTFNALILEMQDFFNQEENYILASDLVVKEAEKIETAVEATIVLIPGFDETTTLDNAELAVSNFIAALKLGEDLNPSDIVGVLENIDGIDSVVLASVVPASKVDVDRTQYVRASSIDVTV